MTQNASWDRSHGHLGGGYYPPLPRMGQVIDPPRMGQVIDLTSPPPHTHTHTGTTANVRAVRILLECILVILCRKVKDLVVAK